MIQNKEIEYIKVGRTKLTERSLNEISNNIKEKYGLDVLEILENDNGYVFKGKYGFTIGDVTYNNISGKYSPFNFHHGVIESIESQDRKAHEHRENQRRRNYKIQRNTKIGLAITAAGMVALIGLGVIKNIQQIQDGNQVGVVTEVDHLNTLKNANDIILLEWANYAMNGVSDSCNSSEYEAIKSLRDDTYLNIFVPVMTSYYNYIDMTDSGLPMDIISESIEKNHNTFRNNVYSFDKYLEESCFPDLTFTSSPFTDAIVLDSTGKIISSKGGQPGELKDELGNIITQDSESGKVYVKATSIPGQNYTIDNLPEDAVVVNGEAYVLASHLYNTKNLNNSI